MEISKEFLDMMTDMENLKAHVMMEHPEQLLEKMMDLTNGKSLLTTCMCCFSIVIANIGEIEDKQKKKAVGETMVLWLKDMLERDLRGEYDYRHERE